MHRKYLELWQPVDSLTWLILLHTFFAGKFLTEYFLMQRYDVTCEQLRKLLVSLDIRQYNGLVNFAVKKSTVSEISKNHLMIFLNLNDILNLEELQVDDISAKFTAESIKNYIKVSLIRFQTDVFPVLSVRIGSGQYHTCLLLGFVQKFGIT